MSNPVVRLKSWEYERGFEVGIRRFTANWNKSDAAHYDRSRMEEDRKAQAAAALCEIAVARYTNQYWHGHVWHPSDHAKNKSEPDVGLNIEVRRVRTASAVAIRRTDAGRIVWAARMADTEFRSVELLGSVPADEVISSISDGASWAYLALDLLDRPWTVKSSVECGA